MTSTNSAIKEKKISPKLVETVFDAQLKPSLDRLSKANPENVLDVAASQLEVMNVYYHEVLGQARKSFYSAWLATLLGLLVLGGFIIFYQISRNQNIAIIGTVSGVLVEFIGGVNFYLHGRTSEQLAKFHNRLEWTQRYLMAHSICESLDGEYKQRGRLELVRSIFGIEGNSVIEPRGKTEESSSET